MAPHSLVSAIQNLMSQALRRKGFGQASLLTTAARQENCIIQMPDLTPISYSEAAKRLGYSHHKPVTIARDRGLLDGYIHPDGGIIWHPPGLPSLADYFPVLRQRPGGRRKGAGPGLDIRRSKEHWDAELARLKVIEKQETLVRRTEVDAEMAQATQEIREYQAAVAQGIAEKLAGIVDATEEQRRQWTAILHRELLASTENMIRKYGAKS